MDRREWLFRIGVTLGVNAVLLPPVMIMASGHIGGELNPVVVVVLVIAGLLFLLPPLATWFLVSPWAGPVAGGVAVAVVQLGWVFWVVSRLRGRWLKRQRAIEIRSR